MAKRKMKKLAAHNNKRKRFKKYIKSKSNIEHNNLTPLNFEQNDNIFFNWRFVNSYTKGLLDLNDIKLTHDEISILKDFLE